MDNYFLILILVLIIVFVGNNLLVKAALLAVIIILMMNAGEKFDAVQVAPVPLVEKPIYEIRKAENDLTLDESMMRKHLSLGAQAEESLRRQQCNRFGWGDFYREEMDRQEALDWWNDRDLPDINPVSKNFDMEITDFY